MYIKVDINDTIIDCIDYESYGYIKFNGDIPNICHGGWHKLINSVIIEQVELNPTTIENRLKEATQPLKDQLSTIGKELVKEKLKNKVVI